VDEPFDSGPARLRCHPLGCLDVNGMKSLPSVLDVKTDRIYNAVSVGKRICYRSLVVNIGLHGLMLRIIRTKLSVSPIRMPGRDPNGKSAIAQMPNDPAAEKASSAEHSDGATARCHHDSNSPVMSKSLALGLVEVPIRAITVRSCSA
jgi:hypothetical protein